MDDLVGTQRRIFESELSTPEKITALALLGHWSRAGKGIFPSHTRLARWTGLGRSTVNRALGMLEERGAIRRVRELGKPTHYDLSALAKLPPERDYPRSGTTLGASVDYPQSGTELPPQRGTKGSNKRSKKKTISPSPNAKAYSRVKDHYLSTFETRRKAKPVFDGADGNAIARLLKKCGGDAKQACQVITSAFSSFRAGNISIIQIAKDPTQFIGSDPDGPPVDPEWEKIRPRVLAAQERKEAREEAERAERASARANGAAPDQGTPQIAAIQKLVSGIVRPM